MPRNMVPRIAAMPAMVIPAFLDSGRLKAVTPLEIVSTPVSAVQPEEKARRSRNSVRLSTAGTCLGSARKDCPVRICTSPTPTISKIVPTNR